MTEEDYDCCLNTTECRCGYRPYGFHRDGVKNMYYVRYDTKGRVRVSLSLLACLNW